MSGWRLPLAMVALSKQTIGFAEAINKASAEAIKLGLGIEKFDQLRLGLEKAGISAACHQFRHPQTQGKPGEAGCHQPAEGLPSNLQRLQAAGARFAAGAAPACKQLIAAARGIGPAADFAREALVKLGQAVPPKEKFDPVIDAFSRLGIAAGSVDQRLPEIVSKLQQLPDGAERTQMAITLLGSHSALSSSRRCERWRGRRSIRASWSAHQAVKRMRPMLSNRPSIGCGRMGTLWKR